jgi:TonB family protein
MFTKAIISTVLFTACATTQPMSTFPDHPTGARLEIRPMAAASEDTHQMLPQLVGDAAIPSAQHLNTALHATQDKYELGVRICVSTTGAVSRVDLTNSSGVAELDQAALHDILGWQYASSPGPSRLQTCAPMTVSYAP